MIVCSWLTHWLTDRNWSLAILHVLQFSHHPSRILSGGNICLVGLVGLLTLEGLVSLVTSVCLVTLVCLVTMVCLVTLVYLVTLVCLVTLEGLVTICIICTLQNFQFYLAHLWTDFQSCYIFYHIVQWSFCRTCVTWNPSKDLRDLLDRNTWPSNWINLLAPWLMFLNISRLYQSTL